MDTFKQGPPRVAQLAAAATGMLAGMAAAQECEWSALGSGVTTASSRVNAIAVFDDGMGGGPALYIGGSFTAPASRIARWDGQGWSAVGAGSWNNQIQALAVFDGELYAGGNFTSGGVPTANRVSRWDGQTWRRLGTTNNNGVNDAVHALAVFDGALYLGGWFTMARGDVPVDRVARWDGQTWSAVGAGFVANYVAALGVYDDGGGAALYAGGGFRKEWGAVGDRIAKWDGAIWSEVGSGMSSGWVYSLAAHGGQLYAGGLFTSAGGVSANNIARWNGQTWAALGSGVADSTFALAVFGDSLYAGGAFTSAGGVQVNHISRWDGASWSPLGTGLTQGSPAVQGLAAFGDILYAGGGFTQAGGVTANRIAGWSCTPPPCYANCDGSTVAPILNVDDFTCFINAFAQASQLPTVQEQIDHYANCDASTIPPVLNIDDFTCFINAFATGCP